MLINANKMLLITLLVSAINWEDCIVQSARIIIASDFRKPFKIVTPEGDKKVGRRAI